MYVKETFDREDINYYFKLLSKEIKKEDNPKGLPPSPITFWK